MHMSICVSVCVCVCSHTGHTYVWTHIYTKQEKSSWALLRILFIIKVTLA